MAAERLSMRQIREILRQKWTLGRSHREVTQQLGAGLGTVSGVERRARAAGLDWPQVEVLSDAGLEARLYGPPTPPTHHRPVPDCARLHAERQRPGVTLELLHLEYLEQHPDGYRYTQFCEVYRRWLQRRGLSMRQVHHAGDKCFADYAGKKPRLIEPTTGEVTEVELFVAVLGASNYTYAEATRTQQVPDWLASHQRAFQFFGGVTTAVVCDQLKSGVTLACRYEPGLQRTYEEFAQHYGTVILPARPAHPRDKPKIEVAVQIVERWILARLRHETFFSLAALNARIAELLADLNARPMRLYRASRSELFARLDQPALRPLPAAPFVYGEWKINARVNIDYHIELHGHYYSVPYALIHEHVDARLTATPCPRPPHHRPGPHAQGPSAASRVDALAPHHLGPHDRPADRRPRPGDPRGPPASGAGLSLLSRPLAAGQAVRRAPAGGGLCASRLRRRPLLPSRRLDAQTRP